MHGGQGSFKVCISIYDETDLTVKDSLEYVMIIFIAFSTKENRYNISLLIELQKLKEIQNVFYVVDLKVLRS